MAFRIIHSNQVEVLARQLLGKLASEPLADPLAPEHVLVDNRVLGSWLNLQLALHKGIAANMCYLQPHQLFWQLARAVRPGLPQETPLAKEEMAWTLYNLFGEEAWLASDAMKPVQHYLQDEGCRDLKRYQLAAAVADLFDQYLIYRPEMMLEWEDAGPSPRHDADPAWQRGLWQKLAGSEAGQAIPGWHHRAAIEKSLLQELDSGNSDALRQNIVMQRLSVFGMTSMPPRLLDMLMLLGKHIPVDLYVLNPCREYWFDIKPARTLVKNRGKREAGPGIIGNPLLASQGQQAREFIEALYARLDQFPFEEQEDYREPGRDTLLHCIQQEILDLQYQGGMAELAVLADAGQKQPVPPSEGQKAVRSVQVHNCHSALREVEVLHDQLIALFAQDPTIMPRDVVVMMPQVGPYVPYIDTVFAATSHSLPYHINDRTWLEEVPLLQVFDGLLQLPESRLTLTEVVGVLEVPAVQARFRMDREGFEKLKTWLRDAGARWGLDAAHREKEGLPSYSEFSWEFALHRLLAGYAMDSGVAAGAGQEPLLLEGYPLPVMPFAEVEGGAAALLDSFLQYWGVVKKYRALLAEPGTLDTWATRIAALLDDFFDAQSEEEQLALREIRRQIVQLRKASQWCHTEVGLPVVRSVLQPVLQAASQGGHPWREGIKFCSLMPMRGVPFRVVYLLGMNQSDYPKRSAQPGFDVMRLNHQPGDRSRRIDDRWLFLEALLSARDAFHVSYVGRDQRKNEERQPSVVLAELLDYLRRGYKLDGLDDAEGKRLLQVMIQEHPLQPFSRAYFVQDEHRKLVSYNKQAYEIVSRKQPDANGDESSAAWQESAKAETPVEVSLESFVRFFCDPPKWYFRDRCANVSLQLRDESLPDSEILQLDSGLDEWAFKDALCQVADSIPPTGSPEQRVADLLAVVEKKWVAEGKWPLGAGGDNLREKIGNAVSMEWLDARHGIGAQPMAASGRHECVTSRGKLVVSGELVCLGETYFIHKASNHSDKYQLETVIRSAFAGISMPSVTRAVAVFWNRTKTIEDLANRPSERFLKELAELYMQYREQGLPFAPALSLAYKPEYDEDPAKWEQKVEDQWLGNGHQVTGLSEEIESRAYYMTCERVLHKDFSEVAAKVVDAMQQWESQEKQP